MKQYLYGFLLTLLFGICVQKQSYAWMTNDEFCNNTYPVALADYHNHRNSELSETDINIINVYINTLVEYCVDDLTGKPWLGSTEILDEAQVTLDLLSDLINETKFRIFLDNYGFQHPKTHFLYQCSNKQDLMDCITAGEGVCDDKLRITKEIAFNLFVPIKLNSDPHSLDITRGIYNRISDEGNNFFRLNNGRTQYLPYRGGIHMLIFEGKEVEPHPISKAYFHNYIDKAASEDWFTSSFMWRKNGVEFFGDLVSFQDSTGPYDPEVRPFEIWAKNSNYPLGKTYLTCTERLGRHPFKDIPDNSTKLQNIY